MKLNRGVRGKWGGQEGVEQSASVAHQYVCSYGMNGVQMESLVPQVWGHMQLGTALEEGRGHLVLILPLSWKNHVLPVVSNFLGSKMRRLEKRIFKMSSSYEIPQLTNLSIVKLFIRLLFISTFQLILEVLSSWLHTCLHSHLEKFIYLPILGHSVSRPQGETRLELVTRALCAIRQLSVSCGCLRLNLFFHYGSHFSNAPQPCGLVAAVQGSTDIECSCHHRNFYWTILQLEGKSFLKKRLALPPNPRLINYNLQN